VVDIAVEAAVVEDIGVEDTGTGVDMDIVADKGTLVLERLLTRCRIEGILSK
jgi:hypothetical protein